MLRSCAARSVCWVEARFCCVASWMFAIAWRICAMPAACCPADATICAAACAASSTASARVGWSRPASVDLARRAATCLVPCSVAITAALVARWISPRICRTCIVAFLDCSGQAFTSPATTAKPRPCSPARAASTAALSASRLVCSAMSLTAGDDLPDGLRLLGQRDDALGDGLHLLPHRGDRGSRLLHRLPAGPRDFRRALGISATVLARWAACSAVCATSSTVATVSVTAAEDSLAPDACWVVAARISAVLDARTPVASRSGPPPRGRASNLRSCLPGEPPVLPLRSPSASAQPSPRSRSRRCAVPPGHG